MIERLPGHSFVVALGIGLGAVYLLAAEVISIFTL